MAWNVAIDPKIDPPTQAKYSLSGGPTTFTFALGGTKVLNYFISLSGTPGNIVDPPLKITLL